VLSFRFHHETGPVERHALRPISLAPRRAAAEAEELLSTWKLRGLGGG
jgi:hypothetical protein